MTRPEPHDAVTSSPLASVEVQFPCSGPINAMRTLPLAPAVATDALAAAVGPMMRGALPRAWPGWVATETCKARGSEEYQPTLATAIRIGKRAKRPCGRQLSTVDR